jgi:hypothetical protein
MNIIIITRVLHTTLRTRVLVSWMTRMKEQQRGPHLCVRVWHSHDCMAMAVPALSMYASAGMHATIHVQLPRNSRTQNLATHSRLRKFVATTNSR